jgi:very-short-patch-repair endonuclease
VREGKAQMRAIELRHRLTETEQRLWRHLKLRQLLGFKFRRQVPIGPYIADFSCVEAKLIVELDGGQHVESAHDIRRSAYLETQGFRVLRFWNDQVFKETDAVLELIAAFLRPHPSLPPQAGEGDQTNAPAQSPPLLAGEG